MSRVARLVPPGFKRAVRRVAYYGSARHCVVCDSDLRTFVPFGRPPRLNARCPICGALERHRLLWLFFHRGTNIFDGRPKRLLHFAPEAALQRHLARVSGLDYVTADLNGDGVMARVDITDIQFPEASFDVVLCSHVLEHVPEDRKAMRELFRVIKPGGYAVIMVPVSVHATFEDPTVTDPVERERLFGQDDHVRRYGFDVRDRLAEVGLDVRCIAAGDIVRRTEFLRYGISERETVFLCTKPEIATGRP